MSNTEDKRGSESVESISHLDGCHFYCWLIREDGNYSVTFDEREDDDLFLHGRFDAEGEREHCHRCRMLRRSRDRHAIGPAKPRHLKVALPDYPKDADAREGFLHTLAAVGHIDETPGQIDRVTLADLGLA